LIAARFQDGVEQVDFARRHRREAGNDTFVFEHGTGGDVIGDFAHGSDRMNVHDFGFASFATLANSFHQVGSDGAIDLGGGDLIVLLGVTMSTLDAGDFVL
jgi:hypothetical protein